MEIQNKVAASGLLTIDLEELHVKGDRILFDIKGWLFQELILREKDFREHIKNHDWSQYSGKLVAITCTADAIVPTWAYMLVSSALQPFAKAIVFGDLFRLEEFLYQEQILRMNPDDYKDQKVVIKGCSNIEVPVSAYVQLTAFLRPLVRSIMYGEPCSTVPVYKAKSDRI